MTGGILVFRKCVNCNQTTNKTNKMHYSFQCTDCSDRVYGQGIRLRMLDQTAYQGVHYVLFSSGPDHHL